MVYRMSLADIIDQIRLAMGEPDIDLSKITNSQLVDLINAYGNSIPSRLNQVAREHGKSFDEGVPKHPMWLTKTSITSSGSLVTFPSDMSSLQELWLEDYDQPLEWEKTFRGSARKRGIPKKVFISGVDASGNMTGELIPSTSENFNIRVVYYRIPASFPGEDFSSEYPDAHPKYHLLWVVGPLTLIMAPDDPMYGEYKRLEQEFLRNLFQESGARN